MDARLTLTSHQPPAVSNNEATRSSVPTFSDDAHRGEWLIETLGEQFCRKLGLFRIPEDLTLSVVIPVYNEKATILEILRRVRAVPIKQADHRRRRLLDRRDPRDPPRAGPARRAT